MTTTVGGPAGGALLRRRSQPSGRRELVAVELEQVVVAVSSRHCDLIADLPRRRKRLAPRFDFTWPKTGSTMPWRRR
jgi:hypothetical protein